jgi:hypothetical protein
MKKCFLFLFILLTIFFVLNCSLQGGGDEFSFNEVLKLTAGDAEDSDLFGISAAIAGDYVIVGASLKDGAGSFRGEAYIYIKE